MIDLSLYKLKYTDKTNKVFLGRRVDGMDYVLVDPETLIKIRVTRHKMKDYKPDPKNKNQRLRSLKR